MPALRLPSALDRTYRRPLAWGLLAGLLSAGLLIYNTAARLEASDMASLYVGWRGWDDLAIATGAFLSGEYPVSAYPIRDRFRRKSDEFAAFRDRLLGQTAAAGLRPSRFWRTLPPDAIPPGPLGLARRFDDGGRAWLLVAGFRALGGVAPYLLPWLAVLLFVPLLLWTGLELSTAGRPVSAAVFLALLAMSAFVVDALTLTYSAVGFYLAGVLALVPLAAYALLRPPTLAGLAARTAAAGLVLSVSIACRNAGLLLLPAYIAVIAAGAWRARPTSPSRRRWALAAAVGGLGAAVLLLPHLAIQWHSAGLVSATLEKRGMRRRWTQEHDVWVTLWQGLGDFDRTKGHIYFDMAGEKAVRDAGGDTRLSPKSEAILRGLVLRDIREDPLWFAAILTRRVVATVTLWKLHPWGPRDGRSIVAASTENEGVTDNYYRMIAQADWLRWGRTSWELPLLVVLAGTPIVLALALLPRRAGRLGEAQRVFRAASPVVLVLALGALATPVAITTASAFETETFVLVHLLAAAIGVDGLWGAARRRTG